MIFWFSYSVKKNTYRNNRAFNQQLTGSSRRETKRRTDCWLQSLAGDCAGWGSDMYRQISKWTECLRLSIIINILISFFFFLYLYVLTVFWVTQCSNVKLLCFFCCMTGQSFVFYLSHYLTNLMHKICFTVSYFIPLHVSSTCAHHQEVKIALHSYRRHDRWITWERVIVSGHVWPIRKQVTSCIVFRDVTQRPRSLNTLKNIHMSSKHALNNLPSMAETRSSTIYFYIKENWRCTRTLEC